MCIIAYAKDRGLTDNELENCVDSNEDGTGFAWYDGCWNVSKGYFDAGEIKKVYQSIKQFLPHVVHARIATHGAISPENCHPFPCTGENVTYEINTQRDWLFHNGIWLSNPTDKCDSHLLAELVGMNSYDLLKSFADTNKFLFIDHLNVEPIMYGKWISKNGVEFSNYAFEAWDTYSYWDYKLNKYVTKHYSYPSTTNGDYCDICFTSINSQNSVWVGGSQRLCLDCFAKENDYALQDDYESKSGQFSEDEKRLLKSYGYSEDDIKQLTVEDFTEEDRELLKQYEHEQDETEKEREQKEIREYVDKETKGYIDGANGCTEVTC